MEDSSQSGDDESLDESEHIGDLEPPEISVSMPSHQLHDSSFRRKTKVNIAAPLEKKHSKRAHPPSTLTASSSFCSLSSLPWPPQASPRGRSRQHDRQAMPYVRSESKEARTDLMDTSFDISPRNASPSNYPSSFDYEREERFDSERKRSPPRARPPVRVSNFEGQLSVPASQLYSAHSNHSSPFVLSPSNSSLYSRGLTYQSLGELSTAVNSPAWSTPSLSTSSSETDKSNRIWVYEQNVVLVSPGKSKVCGLCGLAEGVKEDFELCCGCAADPEVQKEEKMRSEKLRSEKLREHILRSSHCNKKPYCFCAVMDLFPGHSDALSHGYMADHDQIEQHRNREEGRRQSSPAKVQQHTEAAATSTQPPLTYLTPSFPLQRFCSQGRKFLLALTAPLAFLERNTQQSPEVDAEFCSNGLEAMFEYEESPLDREAWSISPSDSWIPPAESWNDRSETHPSYHNPIFQVFGGVIGR